MPMPICTLLYVKFENVEACIVSIQRGITLSLSPRLTHAPFHLPLPQIHTAAENNYIDSS